MKSTYTGLVLLSCVSLCLVEDVKDPSPSCCNDDVLATDHHRVSRQLDGSIGVSALAIATFGAFLMYVVYYHMTKYLQGGRALEENMLDLTTIMTCLEKEEFTPDLHLHCFFPAYFSRKESMGLSKTLWRTAERFGTQRFPGLWEDDEGGEITILEDIRDLTRKVGAAGETHGAHNCTSSCHNRVKRQFGESNIISLLAIAAFGIFLFYVLYYHITKYLQGRSLDSFSVEDHLREMTRVLQCLQDEDFVPRIECFVSSSNLNFGHY